MAAVATKKPGADTGVALTFPTVYEYTYADEGRGERFAQEAPLPRTDEMPGGLDLQDDYHQQKYLDARAMAFAALASRRSADKRMMLSHANYFGMPAPVLGQRRFANPSLGNQSGAIDSARRTMATDGAPFHCAMDAVAGSGLSGGVLRSAEGQRYGRSLLQRRVKQLDAIDAADATFTETTSVAPLSDAYPIKAQLELNTLLDAIRAQVAAGTTASVRFFIEDFGKLIRTIARFAAVADREQLEDAVSIIDQVTEQVLARSAAEEFLPAADLAEYDMRFAYNEIVLPRMTALRRYLSGMLAGVLRSPAERKALSSNLLKSSGLTRLGTPAEAVMEEMRRLRPGPRAAMEIADNVMERRERLRDPFPAVGPRVARRVQARFAVPARPREEDEADEVDEGFGAGAGARRRFDRDQRQVFGERAGAFFGEEAPAAPARAAAPMRMRPEAAAPAAAAAPAGRGRGRMSNPMRKDRSSRMSVAVATREAPEPAFASLLGRRGR